METFQELRTNYLRAYTTLSVYCYYNDIDESHHEIARDLNKGEAYWAKWGDLSDLQHWIDDISEAVDMEISKTQLCNDPIEQPYLLTSEVCTIG